MVLRTLRPRATMPVAWTRIGTVTIFRGAPVRLPIGSEFDDSNPRRFEPRLSVATDQPFGFAPDPSFNPSRLGFVKLHSLTSRSVVKNDGQYLPRLHRQRPGRARLHPVR